MQPTFHITDNPASGVELPSSALALREYLKERLAAYRAALAEQEQRLGVLQEFEPLLAEATQLLLAKRLPAGAEADAVLAAVRSELAATPAPPADAAREAPAVAGVDRHESEPGREQTELARMLSNATAAVAAAPYAAAPEVDASAEGGNSRAVAADSGETVALDGVLAESTATEQRTSETEQRTAEVAAARIEAYQGRLTELTEDADLLLESGKQLDLEELHARVAILAGRARRLQDAYPDVKEHDERTRRATRSLFGRLTRLCKELLNPNGRFIPILTPEVTRPWGDWIREWKDRLDAVLAGQQEAAAERERQHRRERWAAQNRQYVEAVVLPELEALSANAPEDSGTPEQRDEWADDLRELIGECLRFGEASDARLLTVVERFPKIVSHGSEFRALRRRLRKRGLLPESGASAESARAEPVTPDAAVAPPPPSSMLVPGAEEFTDAFREALAGKRAAMIGGTRREERRQALERFFGLASLDWIENERSRAADGAAIAARILHGRYDLVLLLARFCGHHVQEQLKPACLKANVPFVVVRRGYGITRVCQALAAAGVFDPTVAPLPPASAPP